MATLTGHDRCDRCGAQAYVRTRHQAGDLLWCWHHGNEYELSIGLLIVDDDRRELSDA